MFMNHTYPNQFSHNFTDTYIGWTLLDRHGTNDL
jgi:hypothetical protein